MTVLINWQGNSELHLCQGRLVAKEQGLTALKDVTCPSGAKFYEVVGVDEKRLVVVQ